MPRRKRKGKGKRGETASSEDFDCSPLGRPAPQDSSPFEFARRAQDEASVHACSTGQPAFDPSCSTGLVSLWSALRKQKSEVPSHARSSPPVYLTCDTRAGAVHGGPAENNEANRVHTPSSTQKGNQISHQIQGILCRTSAVSRSWKHLETATCEVQWGP